MLRLCPLLLLVASCAFAADEPARNRPAVILLIRHAEKPPEEARKTGLSAAGKERAAALPGLFVVSPSRPEPFPTPDFLFAASDSAKSHRSRKTIEPLAAKLGVKVDSSFNNTPAGIAGLAKEILDGKRYRGKTILIAWHHGKMPELARALGAKGAPNAYPTKRFDRVWQITYGKKGKATFADLPQRLMPGDKRK